MRRAFVSRSCLALICLAASGLLVVGQENPEEKKPADTTSASRLRAVREFVRQITLTSTEGDTRQPLEIKLDPLLRYNDVTRGILDSVVFRVGTKGRPAALITAELYGREGTTFLLNHEFVALNEPQLRAKRDQFVWQPSQGNVNFKEFRDAEPPVENARLRLAQMRRLAEQFTATQTVGTSQIVLRRISTPLDRYEPSDKPRADGALFVATGDQGKIFRVTAAGHGEVYYETGQAHVTCLAFDREEDYRGAVMVAAESLPPGIAAIAGADYEPDKDPPQNVGKRERYTPRTERMVLVLTASPDAAPTAEPQIARIVVRPLMGGKLGDAIETKQILVMVLQKP